MKVINLLNMKGGVAKTFTAVNMAYELWRRGYKVLVWDNDKQGNLSRAYRRYDAENVASAAKILEGEWECQEGLIQSTDYEGIDIIIANVSLFGVTCTNAFAVTDEVIVPVKIDEDSLEGLDIVAEQIEDAKAINPALILKGVLVTSY